MNKVNEVNGVNEVNEIKRLYGNATIRGRDYCLYMKTAKGLIN